MRPFRRQNLPKPPHVGTRTLILGFVAADCECLDVAWIHPGEEAIDGLALAGAAHPGEKDDRREAP